MRLKKGDVVMYQKPATKNYLVLKRITKVWTDPDSGLPPFHVFMEGDNSPASEDSRTYGSIPISLIEGRALARVWPPSRFGRLPEYKLE
jgi:hypothetical protein